MIQNMAHRLTKEEQGRVLEFIRSHGKEFPTKMAVFKAAIETNNLQEKLSPMSSNCNRYMKMLKKAVRPRMPRQALQPPSNGFNGSPLPHDVLPIALPACPLCQARFYAAKGGA